jgi:hypothetical protein
VKPFHSAPLLQLSDPHDPRRHERSPNPSKKSIDFINSSHIEVVAERSSTSETPPKISLSAMTVPRRLCLRRHDFIANKEGRVDSEPATGRVLLFTKQACLISDKLNRALRRVSRMIGLD